MAETRNGRAIPLYNRCAFASQRVKGGRRPVAVVHRARANRSLAVVKLRRGRDNVLQNGAPRRASKVAPGVNGGRFYALHVREGAISLNFPADPLRVHARASARASGDSARNQNATRVPSAKREPANLKQMFDTQAGTDSGFPFVRRKFTRRRRRARARAINVAVRKDRSTVITRTLSVCARVRLCLRTHYKV